MKTIIKFMATGMMAATLWQCTPRNAETGAHGHDEHAGHNDEHAGHVDEHAGHDDEHAGHDDEHAEQAGEGVGGSSVVLTDIQIASAGIITGGLDTMNASGYINANGIFDLPPENIAAVNAPMAGIVKEANYLEGSHVVKGAELVVLEHPSYIKLQEEYLAILSSLTYLEAEYERQRTLDSAKVAARKALQRAEADYRTARARKLSLEKQLAYLGVDPAVVARGELTSTISVKAPISGYITQLNVHNGEFVQSEQEMYELINPDHMHLELKVYEKDIAGVRKGQPIRFTVPGLGAESYDGEVYLVGKSFDQETKTVTVHGHFHAVKPEFRRGLYVEALIFTGSQPVAALPEEAVIRDGGKTYIFIREASTTREAGSEFRRVEVATGLSRNGLVQIVASGKLPSDARIVVKGAYDIFAEMKKGEGGHGHAH